MMDIPLYGPNRNAAQVCCEALERYSVLGFSLANHCSKNMLK